MRSGEPLVMRTGPVGIIVGGAYFLANLFYDIFSGGGPDYPPNYWTYLYRETRPHGGRHPLYTEMIGASPYLIVDQAGFKLVSANGGPSIDPPLVKTSYRHPGGSESSRIVKLAGEILLLAHDLAVPNGILGGSLIACATAAEAPAGPISAGACAVVVGAELGPPVLWFDYIRIRAFLKDYRELK